MAKLKEEKIVLTEEHKAHREEVVAKLKKTIPLLTVDFAREDLNTIARKLNEVIEHINAN